MVSDIKASETLCFPILIFLCSKRLTIEIQKKVSRLYKIECTKTRLIVISLKRTSQKYVHTVKAYKMSFLDRLALLIIEFYLNSELHRYFALLRLVAYLIYLLRTVTFKIYLRKKI